MSRAPQPGSTGQEGRLRRAARAFRRWRRSRPFWGALLVLLGSLEILASQRAPLPLVIHIGLQGLAGYLVPVVLLLTGVLLLVHPVQRLFYSLLAILLALGSWITSNLGGFFVGMLLALIGGAMAFAWRGETPQQAALGAEPSGRGGAGPGSGSGSGSGPGPESGEDVAPEPARGDPGRQPRHARSAGLALVRSSRPGRADRGETADLASQSGRDGRGGQRGGRSHRGGGSSQRGGRSGRGDAAEQGYTAEQGGSGQDAVRGDRQASGESGNSALLAVPLLPLAVSVLAAVGSRGLLTSSVPPGPLVPVVPAAASPSVSPLPSPPVPAPRPSPDPSPTSRSRPPHRHHAAHRPDAAVAAESFLITAKFAALTGLTYDGVAKVPTAHGTTPMLKFTMSSLRLPGAALAVRSSDAGSFSMADSSLEFSGDVEFYTTRLSGVLHGIKVTFTAAKPPASLPANLTLTDVTAEQPYASADLMRAAGSQLSTG